MKCTRCRETAAVSLPSHTAGFCSQCFLVFIERQIQKAIKDKKLFTMEDKIIIALSGGKDSLALAWQLKKLGYEIAGLHIDLAIPQSSPIARDHVEKFCRDKDIRLFVLEMDKLGMPIPEIRKKIKRPVCSVCGKIKRYYFNKFAVDNGFTVLATGHNLDDEVARLLSNVFRWDAAYLGDQGPLLPAENGFVRKVKPLYRLSEFETANFCFIAEIDYGFSPCPYSKGASFTFYKTLLDELEQRQPGSKLSFYEGFLKRGQKAFAQMDIKEGRALSPCKKCGFPTSADTCGVCRIRQMLENG